VNEKIWSIRNWIICPLGPFISYPIKAKPTLKRIKDGKKIAMKKKINIGFPISNQIYVFYFNIK